MAAHQALKPGDTVPVSGIYRVSHLKHRVPHDVLAIRGEELPPCRTCAGDVRFHMTHSLGHMTEDWDLTGPTKRMLEEIEIPHRRAA
jgi:hypothetical protein